MIKAAIDIGTNSVRLLVAEWQDGRLRPLYKDLDSTRLGQGVHHSGALSADAIARTVRAVANMARAARARGADEVVAFATSAVREAVNGLRFAHLCRDLAGVDVHILDAVTEARLAYAGAMLGDTGRGDCLVVDIGGGSTELAYGHDGVLQAAESLKLGAVRLAELFPAGPGGAVSDLAAVNDYIGAALAAAPRLPWPSRLIGVGGTATSLAAIKQQLTVYDSAKVHGFYLTLGDIEQLLAELAAMPLDERRRVPGLQPERADIIVYGAAILAAVVKRFGADGITVSDQDILEGVVNYLAVYHGSWHFDKKLPVL
ncbi:Ppx/GppA phosphatase [Thermosinus carboxydivorans Nor1]|uniref:Ppx/GppA phosphatase n=1 Tax=Thermosinus carboxydivorans Nor1 TaxID=401526 RepID=A1HRS4_9FIRM|nr:Ppx/GppA phosphatase [Thermosinus carboxydivorans]EAX47245.1 Ppx/GppA phosphatase [Thermosinus carboxydivorans Nor1]